MKQDNNNVDRKFLMTDRFGQDIYQEDMVYFNDWKPGASDGFDYYPVEPSYAKIDDRTEIIGMDGETGELNNIPAYTLFMPYYKGSIEVGLEREIMKVNLDRLVPSRLSFSQLIENLNRHV